ncbi:MAG: ChrR family anti-sigma-E factor [Kangiellaceae bacterium]|nr:ChrR family anti-sigma-E factor [Kangiellaceae bacterium]MCW8998686.1 ChrR family anti-sigma-E factor [Kangiellaceae bacterium]
MKYHPDIELLLKYSTGQLAPALSVAIGIHQHQCETCRNRINDIELIGGETLENLPSVEASNQTKELNEQDALALLMSQVDATQQDEESSSYEECAVASADLDLLERLGNREFDTFTWKKVTPSISKAEITLAEDDFKVELLKFAANAKIPQHTHEGQEFTVVLEGDFSDSLGQYKSGEFIVQDKTVEHQPVAGSQGCVCLAITTAPLKFTGTFGPVLNWFTR